MKKTTNNKNITVIAYYFGKKMGAGVFQENLLPPLIEQLQANNCDITLITNSSFMHDCGKVIPASVHIQQPRLLTKPVFAKIYFLLFFGFTSYTRNAKHVLFTIDPIVGWKMNNVVSIIHDLNEFAMAEKLGKFRTWFRKTMIKISIKRSQQVIVISNFVKNQILTYLPAIAQGKKIDVIHSGTTLPKEIDSFISNEKRAPFFIVAGRIDPKAKYLYEAVKMFLAYKQQHPNFSLKIVGGINDFCRTDAETFIQYISEIDSIEYLGHISNTELDQLYKTATATIFLSKLEGFGFPVLESFARGCPVITNADNEVNDELAAGMDIKLKETELDDATVVNEKLAILSSIDKQKLVSIAASFSWKKTAVRYCNFLSE
ncbi:hypothetical protein FACS1894162_0860 [Bacteroidia bacterium]|nr:hypothetical protein FACS1894162_0860 [Bacteroidia bacterium]